MFYYVVFPSFPWPAYYYFPFVCLLGYTIVDLGYVFWVRPIFIFCSVLLAGDIQYANYMLRKLNEEYERWRLKINLKKRKYPVIRGNGEGLELGTEKVKKVKNIQA